MPPPSRANNYGPNMHAPPPFAQQGGMQHVSHSLLERERYLTHLPARHSPTINTPSNFQQHHPHHQAQLYAAQAQAQSQQQQAAAARAAQQHAQTAQEKSLLSILSVQGGRGAGMNGAVSAAGLGGAVVPGRGADPRVLQAQAQAQIAHQAQAQAQQQAAQNDSGQIRDVWAEDLEQEMGVLRGLVERYPYVAMVCCCGTSDEPGDAS